MDQNENEQLKFAQEQAEIWRNLHSIVSGTLDSTFAAEARLQTRLDAAEARLRCFVPDGESHPEDRVYADAWSIEECLVHKSELVQELAEHVCALRGELKHARKRIAELESANAKEAAE